MQDISELVTHNFNENISYFETSHPQLFKNIVALESAMENGHYQEKYELVYEDENFDVLEKSSNNYLYNKQSKKYSKLALESINTNIDNNVFQTFHPRDISDEDLKSIQNKEPFMDHLGGFAPILHYIEHNKHNTDKVEISKFIFFGIGLGLHLTVIDTQISADSYLLIEDDLELFRLSLFTTNYKELAKDARLTFAIFEDAEQFQLTATGFLMHDYYKNHYLKFFHMLSHTEEKQLQMHQLIASQPHLTFFYHTMLKHYTRPLQYLFSGYKFLNSNLKLNKKQLRDKPFLLLAAGPSLEKNKKWLQENHMHVIIVAVAATLPFLEKESIRPDIVVQLDGHLNSILHFERLNSLEFIQESIFFFSDKVPSTIMDMLPKERLFLYEHTTHYKKNALKPTAFCVGSVALELLVLLEVKQIYLLRLDLALDQETGATHSDSHVLAKNINLEESSQEENTLEYSGNLVEVEGNHTQKLLTTQHFNESIKMINYFMSRSKKVQQKIVNLSYGARFNATVPSQPKELNFSYNLNKEEVKSKILKELLHNSTTVLSSYELTQIKRKKEHAQKIQKKLTLLTQSSLSSSQNYLDELKRFCNSIADKEDIATYEINQILDAYLRYIIPHIFHYIYNSVNDEEYKTIYTMLIKHLNEIINFYLKAIESKKS